MLHDSNSYLASRQFLLIVEGQEPWLVSKFLWFIVIIQWKVTIIFLKKRKEKKKEVPGNQETLSWNCLCFVILNRSHNFSGIWFPHQWWERIELCDLSSLPVLHGNSLTLYFKASGMCVVEINPQTEIQVLYIPTSIFNFFNVTFSI